MLSQHKILTMTSLVLLACISLGINQLSAVKTDKCEGCPVPGGEGVCMDLTHKNKDRCRRCCEDACFKQEKDFQILVCQGVCDDEDEDRLTCKCTTGIP